MNEIHETYRAAVRADDAFEAALKVEGYRRWEWVPALASKALREAYRAKLDADAALHKAFEDSRSSD